MCEPLIRIGAPLTHNVYSPLRRRFLKGLEERDLAKAQLGLAHSYSRAKVKFNVNKADNMIIQVGACCVRGPLGGL